MRHNYVGDIADFAKYGFLRQFCGTPEQPDPQTRLNQSQGGMCICRVLGIGAGVSRECFGP